MHLLQWLIFAVIISALFLTNSARGQPHRDFLQFPTCSVAIPNDICISIFARSHAKIKTSKTNEPAQSNLARKLAHSECRTLVRPVAMTNWEVNPKGDLHFLLFSVQELASEPRKFIMQQEHLVIQLIHLSGSSFCLNLVRYGGP